MKSKFKKVYSMTKLNRYRTDTSPCISLLHTYTHTHTHKKYSFSVTPTHYTLSLSLYLSLSHLLTLSLSLSHTHSPTHPLTQTIELNRNVKSIINLKFYLLKASQTCLHFPGSMLKMCIHLEYNSLS